MPFRQVVPYLSGEQVAGLYERCLYFLEKKGFKIENARLLALLAERGVEVDTDTQMAQFPRALVEQALKSVPESFTLAAPDPAFDLPFPNPTGTFYFRTNTGGSSWYEPETGEYRRVRRADVAVWGRLMSQLPNVDFVAFPSPIDVPDPTADIHALHTLLQNSAKHVWIQPYSEDTLPHLIALSQAAAGGAEALKARPIVSVISCSLTPFAFKPMDADIFIDATAAGIPIQACSLPTAGGTAPMTEAGTTLVHGIEIMAQTVIIQLLKPGHPVIGTTLAFSMDMQAGRALQSSPEAMRIASWSVQFVKEAIRIPVHTYGAGSDSPILDAQVPAEAGMLATLVAKAGADVLGAGGQFDVATAISPIQLICDNEMVGALRKVVSPFADDEESLGWKAILDTEPMDSFLMHEHTYNHCREAWRARLYTRESREGWRAAAGKDIWGRAMDTYHDLMQNPAPDVLGEGAKADMQQVVEAADRALVQ
jgi:trimethylamine---corrinoid protein Co-methyltransferase